MRRIRLMHLIASGRGGGASHVRDLALGLSADRFDVQVVMPPDDGNVGAAHFARSPVTFHPLRVAHAQDWRAMARLRALIARQRCELLHLHGARAAFFGRLVHLTLRPPRPKLLYSVHGFMLPHYRPVRRVLSLAQELAQSPQVDRFIAVSHAERDALLAAGFPRRVDVVWLGIDADAFEHPRTPPAQLRGELGIRPDEVVATCICRFFWPRDFETLVRGFARARRRVPALRLLLVGDGPWKPRVLSLLAEQGVEEAAVLPGFRQDVADVLHASDLFVLTSGGGDGLPVSILEAMAAARPVVATASDGIPEEVVDGETGQLVPVGGVDELADALARLGESPALRARWGAAGRERIQRHFRREHMIANLTERYLRLVGGAGA